MAKILTFRNKGGDGLDQSFLTDSNQTLLFCMNEDGGISLGNLSRTSLPDLFPDPRKDWRNQELADLFRVRQLLHSANVPVETERGVTDEGDPWFVFCHLNGDVFIHMARIDGIYMLDSPNVCRPLRGRDFNALIADFTNLTLPTGANKAEDTERRVIRLERDGKVRLHPSAMLAALIWTLFLASEDLVLFASEDQTASSDDLLEFSDVIFAADTNVQTLAVEAEEITSIGASEATKELHHETQHGALEAQSVREAISQQGLAIHQNSYAIGLSTIAIAMGFMSEAVFMDNQGKVLEILKSIGLADYNTDGGTDPDLGQFADGSGDTLLKMLADFMNIDIFGAPKTADMTAPSAEAPLLQQDILHENANAEDEIATLLTTKIIQTTARRDDGIDAYENSPENQSHPAEAKPEAISITADAQKDGSAININDLIISKTHLVEFQMGETTVMASFDVTTLDPLFLSRYVTPDTLSTSDIPDTSITNYDYFNDQLQSLIDFINAKDNELGIIRNGDAIIMIDRSAYAHRGEADAYHLTWEDDSGQVISMIGLKSDFQDFDLIA